MTRREDGMAYDEALAKRVQSALGRTRVEARRMFGGLTFMVRGKMCVSVGKETIMCRIDPALHIAALKRLGCRSVTMGGREYRGFVYVRSGALRTKRDLDYWVRLALAYNARAKASNQKRTR